MRAHNFKSKCSFDTNMDRKIRQIQAKIRKLSWHQKLVFMDWINAWYSDYKEQARKEYEEWLGEEE